MIFHLPLSSTDLELPLRESHFCLGEETITLFSCRTQSLISLLNCSFLQNCKFNTNKSDHDTDCPEFKLTANKPFDCVCFNFTSIFHKYGRTTGGRNAKKCFHLFGDQKCSIIRI